MNRNKKYLKTVCALGGAVLLMASSTFSVYALNNQKHSNINTNVYENVDISDNITISEGVVDKDETVYVIANKDGSVDKIIVSDWLKNTDKKSTLSDYSNLTDIINLKGVETFEKDENGIYWNAMGNDIYYQGTIVKQLPVDVRIKYTLDGKDVSVDEISGKSGHLTIKLSYTNNQKETVDIDGKQTDMYIPFVAITGTVLNSETFKDVTVSNARIVNDGDRIAVVGIAFPGMQENLGFGSDVYEIPNSIEINAFVTDFSPSTFMTVVSSEVFSEIGLGNIDNISELKEKLTLLGDASKKLVSGSNALYEGIGRLSDGTSKLTDGVNLLYNGSVSLADGTDKLYDGSSALTLGNQKLNEGLTELDQNSQALIDGAKTVFDTLLATAKTQIVAAGIEVTDLNTDNYSAVITGIIANLSDENITALANKKALDTVTSTVNMNRELIEANVAQAVRENVVYAVRQQTGATVRAAMVGASEEAISSVVDSKMNSDEVIAIINAKMDSDEIKATIKSETEKTIDSLILQNMQSEAVKAQINDGIASAKAGRQSLENALAQLDKYNEFYNGILAYTGGVNQAKCGSYELLAGQMELQKGANDLNGGMIKLKDGMESLKDNTKLLVDGINQLFEGSKELSEGMNHFNEDGIEVLMKALSESDVDTALKRIEAMSELSKTYDTFGGKRDDKTGKVKFIYRS